MLRCLVVDGLAVCCLITERLLSLKAQHPFFRSHFSETAPWEQAEPSGCRYLHHLISSALQPTFDISDVEVAHLLSVACTAGTFLLLQYCTNTHPSLTRTAPPHTECQKDMFVDCELSSLALACRRRLPTSMKLVASTAGCALMLRQGGAYANAPCAHVHMLVLRQGGGGMARGGGWRHRLYAARKSSLPKPSTGAK